MKRHFAFSTKKKFLKHPLALEEIMCTEMTVLILRFRSAFFGFLATDGALFLGLFLGSNYLDASQFGVNHDTSAILADNNLLTHLDV